MSITLLLLPIIPTYPNEHTVNEIRKGPWKEIKTAPWRRVPLEEVIIYLPLINNIYFMEPESLTPYSHHATGPHPKPDPARTLSTYLQEPLYYYTTYT